MLQNPQQALPLLPGQVMDLLPSGDAGQLNDHRDQLLRQQIIQSVLEIVVGVFGKIRQQPLVQLLLIQRGFQVDLQPVTLFGKMPHVGRGRQHQRTADAEVCKQQLAEIRIDLLIVFKGRQTHVPQTQALQADTRDPRRDDPLQGHQRPLQRRDGVPRLSRHPVTVSGGAGGRIADAAGGQHHRLGRVVSPLPNNAADRAVLNLQGRRPVPEDLHLQGLQPPFQRGADVKRAVADGKHPVSPLGFQRNAQLLKKAHHICAIEAVKGAVKELSITRNISQQPLDIRVVGHVAPALAGDIQFFPQPFVGFQQRDSRPLLRRRNSGHHPGGASADHYDLFTHHPHRRIHRTDPTAVPAW